MRQTAPEISLSDRKPPYKSVHRGKLYLRRAIQTVVHIHVIGRQNLHLNYVSYRSFALRHTPVYAAYVGNEHASIDTLRFADFKTYR